MFVYADQAATTRIDERVLSAMMPYLKDGYGNAGSLHTLGEQARQALQTARAQVAALIGADADEIYFTSGGTESDNWVIQGVAQAFRQQGKHFICTDVEHHAVLHPFEHLQKQGYDVSYLHADAQGRVEARQLEQALRPIMNSERLSRLNRWRRLRHSTTFSFTPMPLLPWGICRSMCEKQVWIS